MQETPLRETPAAPGLGAFLAQIDRRPLVIALAGIGLVFAWPLGLAVTVFALFGARLGWRAPVDAFFEGLAGGLGKGGACCCGPAAWYYDTGRVDRCRRPGEVPAPTEPSTPAE